MNIFIDLQAFNLRELNKIKREVERLIFIEGTLLK